MTYRYGTSKNEKAPKKDASEYGNNRLFGCDTCARGRAMLLHIEELEARVFYLESLTTPPADHGASPSDSESPNQPEDTE